MSCMNFAPKDSSQDRNNPVDVTNIDLKEARHKLNTLIDDAFSMLRRHKPEESKMVEKEWPIYDEPVELMNATPDPNLLQSGQPTALGKSDLI